MDTYPMNVTSENVKRLLDYVDVVEHVESYVSTRSGEEIDRLLDIVDYNEYSMPVGVEWDTTSNSPNLRRIDINGKTITPSTSFFDHHQIWGGMWVCVRDRTTGKISYGTNARGDGLTLDGTAGDVLVRIPIARTLCAAEGDFRKFIEIPYVPNDTRYKIDPAGVQRGGIERPFIYVGAYESSIRVGSSGNLLLQSIPGVQPWTGGGISSLAFTSGGTTAFVLNETITGETSGASGTVVGMYVSAGTWAGGDAAGTLYLRQKTGTYQANESLRGGMAGIGAATASGDAAPMSLTMDKAEDYGNAIGNGFGITNIHTWSYLQRLMIIEYGTFNLQTALGRGIVDLDVGVGYAGKYTNSGSIDSNLSENGTGVGTGIDGQTPICWRNIRNPYGNISKFVIGLNGNNSNNIYKILSRTGTASATLSASLAEGTYETGAGAMPVGTSTYIKNIQSDELGALAFIPSEVGGSSTTYLCDYYTSPGSEISICAGSGYWAGGNGAGINYKSVGASPTYSLIHLGCRIEYVPQT